MPNYLEEWTHVPPTTAAELDAARQFVTTHAADESDAALLLEALGLEAAS